MTARPALQVLDGPAALDQLDAFLPAYVEVYVEPPYSEGPKDVKEFTERFARQAATRPHFRLVLARDDEGQVIGFTYGYCLPADTRWWSGLQQPPADPGFTRETGERTFAVIELAVRRPWRRSGVATALHTALLAGMPAERVTLTVRPEPEAAPARQAYNRWGYRSLGPSRPWDDAPLYTAMIRTFDGQP
ncbi:GNAT family N-acetyltransferase [Streptantibioticus rubrisoli]|uniref:GNAT family N-acetyltransferase n=1 Tax=Streptantibioticus rubrisoli TaxID=1387313 RepID=A0ABT1PK90_9ACTN|nr:GNAT family N-acetyltransferase [Streptantibioticus rubrisoli]MCQ4045789.1 GNAT family N-acetyltransferase [Streptantibioticus rubrisoli]